MTLPASKQEPPRRFRALVRLAPEEHVLCSVLSLSAAGTQVRGLSGLTSGQTVQLSLVDGYGCRQLVLDATVADSEDVEGMITTLAFKGPTPEDLAKLDELEESQFVTDGVLPQVSELVAAYNNATGRGHHAVAAQLARQLCTLCPEIHRFQVACHLSTAFAYRSSGQPQVAQTYARRALALDPVNAEAQSLIRGDQARGAQLRRHPRFPVATSVLLQHEQKPPQSLRSRDVSHSGMFISTKRLLPINTRVEVQLDTDLPPLQARVARVQHGHEAGLGLEFTVATNQQRRHLRQMMGSA